VGWGATGDMRQLHLSHRLVQLPLDGVSRSQWSGFRILWLSARRPLNVADCRRSAPLSHRRRPRLTDAHPFYELLLWITRTHLHDASWRISEEKNGSNYWRLKVRRTSWRSLFLSMRTFVIIVCFPFHHCVRASTKIFICSHPTDIIKCADRPWERQTRYRHTVHRAVNSIDVRVRKRSQPSSISSLVWNCLSPTRKPITSQAYRPPKPKLELLFPVHWAQWLGRWTCDWRSRVQSQPLLCWVQLWTSCSHTLSSASGVTTLWGYINQFK